MSCTCTASCRSHVVYTVAQQDGGQEFVMSFNRWSESNAKLITAYYPKQSPYKHSLKNATGVCLSPVDGRTYFALRTEFTIKRIQYAQYGLCYDNSCWRPGIDYSL